MSDDRTIQVVIPPALRIPLEQWLHRRNLELVELPAEVLGEAAEDDLPTFIVGLA
jgi:hypothetical protein